ncbi:UNVERIFIED_CONTAM: hypothetical protein Sangu_2923500 [Sesamum angustifolium]|uniref:Bet v I/Major latex protein domain-containing protein n=1 Tax=Sesamum angustifolium TaxID=2727405 RepID=A0AAW2IML9_9LAMI
MEGVVSREIEVKVSASETWKAYGSLLLAQIGVDAFPDKYSGFKSCKVMATLEPSSKSFSPGVEGPPWYKEEFLVVDDVKRVKVGKFIEGGVLEQGFKSYVVTLEAIEKEEDECIMGKHRLCIV